MSDQIDLPVVTGTGMFDGEREMTEAEVRAALVEPTGTGIFVGGRELTEAEVREMDERIAKVERGGGVVAVPVDPEVVELAERERMGGRGTEADVEAWRRVMESWGFSWVPAERLNATIGPMSHVPSMLDRTAGHDAYGRKIGNAHLYWIKPHAEGQWRSDGDPARRPPRELLRGREMAFAMSDLILDYKTPETFDRWARGRVQNAIAKVAAEREKAEERAKIAARLRRG